MKNFQKEQAFKVKKELKQMGYNIPLQNIQHLLARSYGYENSHVFFKKEKEFNKAFSSLFKRPMPEGENLSIAVGYFKENNKIKEQKVNEFNNLLLINSSESKLKEDIYNITLDFLKNNKNTVLYHNSNSKESLVGNKISNSQSDLGGLDYISFVSQIELLYNEMIIRKKSNDISLKFLFIIENLHSIIRNSHQIFSKSNLNKKGLFYKLNSLIKNGSEWGIHIFASSLFSDEIHIPRTLIDSFSNIQASSLLNDQYKFLFKKDLPKDYENEAYIDNHERQILYKNKKNYSFHCYNNSLSPKGKRLKINNYLFFSDESLIEQLNNSCIEIDSIVIKLLQNKFKKYITKKKNSNNYYLINKNNIKFKDDIEIKIERIYSISNEYIDQFKSRLSKNRINHGIIVNLSNNTSSSLYKHAKENSIEIISEDDLLELNRIKYKE